MGQYIQAGICHGIMVRKKEMEQNRVTFEEFKEGLAKEVSLDLYEIEEVENGYIFYLKDEVLENGELVKFLSESRPKLKIEYFHKERANVMYNCALCSIHACNKIELDKAPKNCPSLDKKIEEIKEIYKEKENFKIAKASALVVSEGYCEKTRLEEIMDFANRCEFENIGIAFCIGLSNEANILCKVLKHNGFTVNSVICKNGGVSKDFIDIKSNVPMCNPIGQAKFLNEAKTDLNILLGLCVGHDSLFIKYSKAPITVLAVKDRVLAHNPLGAIYQAESYYKDKLFPEK